MGGLVPVAPVPSRQPQSAPPSHSLASGEVSKWRRGRGVASPSVAAPPPPWLPDFMTNPLMGTPLKEVVWSVSLRQRRGLDIKIRSTPPGPPRSLVLWTFW